MDHMLAVDMFCYALFVMPLALVNPGVKVLALSVFKFTLLAR